ncbi:hypothetical protein AAIR98_000794 [Elusimicrobium simillimum]|uniref:hypothetical protein n=1 Tax=Elusimicrobium simillimum TaxID=3143438 RepID=UPI003C6FE6C2
MPETKKTINFVELFTDTANVFKVIFPKIWALLFLLVTVPTALSISFFYGRPESTAFSMLGSLSSIVVFAFVLYFAQAALNGQAITVKEAWQKFIKNIVPLITTFVIMLVGIIIYSVLMVISIFIILFFIGIPQQGAAQSEVMIKVFIAAAPALIVMMYFITRIFFAFNYVYLDGLAWFEPFKKSWALSSGHVLKIIALFLLSAVVGSISTISLVFNIPAVTFLITLLLFPVTFYFSTLYCVLFLKLYTPPQA